MLNQHIPNTYKDLSKCNKEGFSDIKSSADAINTIRKLRLYLNQISDRFDVVLRKGPHGFGLTLVDEPVLDNVTLLKIRAVSLERPPGQHWNECGDSQSETNFPTQLVQPGDVLSAFNAVDVVGLRPEEVVRMFHLVAEDEPAVLTVWKISEQPRLLYYPDPRHEIINFYLQKTATGFGFILGNCRDDHQVAKVNGKGDVRMLLRPGDVLIGIGRVRIAHLSHDQVVHLLKKFPTNQYLQFTVRRDSQSSSANPTDSMSSSVYSKLGNYPTVSSSVGCGGPCRTPDFIPASHFFSLPSVDEGNNMNNINMYSNSGSGCLGGQYRRLPPSMSLPTDTTEFPITTTTLPSPSPELPPAAATATAAAAATPVSSSATVAPPPDCVPKSVEEIVDCCRFRSTWGDSRKTGNTYSSSSCNNNNSNNNSNNNNNIIFSSSSSTSNSCDNNAGNTNEELITVYLIRSQSKGYGFRLMGGAEEGCQVYVGDIIPNGPVERSGRVRPGDVITAINGKSTSNLTHGEVVAILESTIGDGQLVMNLLRIQGQREWEVLLQQQYPDQDLGVVLVDAVAPGEPCGVARILPGTPASTATSLGKGGGGGRALRPGDRLIAVDGCAVTGKHHREVARILLHGSEDGGNYSREGSRIIKLRMRSGDGLARLKTIKYELPPDPSEDQIEINAPSHSLPRSSAANIANIKSDAFSINYAVSAAAPTTAAAPSYLFNPCSSSPSTYSASSSSISSVSSAASSLTAKAGSILNDETEKLAAMLASGPRILAVELQKSYHTDEAASSHCEPLTSTTSSCTGNRASSSANASANQHFSSSSSSSGFGFSICGGVDLEQSPPITIFKIMKNATPDVIEKIKPGDQILQVNGIPTQELTHAEVVDQIRSCTSTLSLVIRRG